LGISLQGKLESTAAQELIESYWKEASAKMGNPRFLSK